MPKRKRQQEDSILDIVVTIINGLSRTALIVIGIVAVVLIAGFALVYWMLNSNTASLSAKERVELSPTQIESIKAIGQWEFLSISDE
jgi:type IV secretory pathway TrbD component